MKYLLFITTLFISSYCLAQYDEITIQTEKKAPLPVTKYDSTENIQYQKIFENYSQYIGQDILFYKRAYDDIKTNFYWNFFLITPDTIWHKKRKHPKPKDYTLIKRYKGKLYEKPATYTTYAVSEYLTPAEAIEGQTFKIQNIEIKDDPKYPSLSYLTFTLLDEQNTQILWSLKNEDQLFPAILCSFIKKMKEKYVGKTFVINNQKYYQFEGIDLSTGKDVVICDTLKCINLSFVKLPKDYSLPCLIFTGTDGESYATRVTPIIRAALYIECNVNTDREQYEYKERALRPTDLIDMDTIIAKRERILAEKEAYEKEQRLKEETKKKNDQKAIAAKRQRCLKKFGKEDTDLIMKGRIWLGMTTDMCRESKGEPDHINRTTGSYGTHEQWVYPYLYLYFENGVLKTVQD